MPTSDLQLQRMGLRSLAHLPNLDGFRFTGVKRDGTAVTCHVEKSSDNQMHFVSGADFDDLIGWKECT